MSDQSNDNSSEKKDVQEIDPSKLQGKDTTTEINLDDIDMKGWAKSRGKKK